MFIVHFYLPISKQLLTLLKAFTLHSQATIRPKTHQPRFPPHLQPLHNRVILLLQILNQLSRILLLLTLQLLQQRILKAHPRRFTNLNHPTQINRNSTILLLRRGLLPQVEISGYLVHKICQSIALLPKNVTLRNLLALSRHN